MNNVKTPGQPLIKSFWKSRNLFSKRFLAAGGIKKSKQNMKKEINFILNGSEVFVTVEAHKRLLDILRGHRNFRKISLTTLRTQIMSFGMMRT